MHSNFKQMRPLPRLAAFYTGATRLDKSGSRLNGLQHTRHAEGAVPPVKADFDMKDHYLLQGLNFILAFENKQGIFAWVGVTGRKIQFLNLLL